MKITKKNLVEDRKDGDSVSSPCCGVKEEDEHERKFYMSVPITAAAIKGLKVGESITVTVVGKLAEARTRWSPEIEVEVESLELANKNEFEELVDDDEK